MPLLFVVVMLFLGLGAGTCAAQAAPQRAGVAVVGADILPMTRAGRLKDQTVLISGDRITRVGPRRSVRVPAGYRVVSGTGLTLMPGLVDMHVHLAPVPARAGDPAQRALAVMLAHGVTTARTMAGAPVHRDVRQGLEAGTIVGPRLYAAAPAIATPNAPTADAARAAVAAAKQAGFDLIKSHHIEDPAVWQAVQDEAARQGVPVAGHVVNAVGLKRALAARQQVEHLDGALVELIPANAPARQIAFGQIPPPPVIEALGGATDTAIAALARDVAASGGYQVPTLSLFEKIVDLAGPTQALASRPEMRFAPDAAIAQWSAQREQMRGAGFTPELASRFVEVRRRLVRAFHRAGVPLMAGSDTAQAFHVWGPGLLEEIEAFAAAGLTPMQALRTATVVPRDYFRSLPNGGSALGWKADFGTVEAGARADLILVAGDPSRDLKALRNLKTVIAGGRVHDRAALDALLAQAAADAKRPAPQAAAATAGRKVYVMRHLHTTPGTPDPELTPEGAAAARELPAFLAAAGIKTIFVTETRRSRASAAHLAETLGLTPQVYDPRDPAALAARVAAVPGDVLIMGHSNTVADLVTRFGGAPITAPRDTEFGTVWRVDGPGDTRTFRLGGVPPAALNPCSPAGLSPSSRCGVFAVPENPHELDVSRAAATPRPRLRVAPAAA